jgi:hypothetical protein
MTTTELYLRLRYAQFLRTRDLHYHLSEIERFAVAAVGLSDSMERLFAEAKRRCNSPS